MFTRFSARLLSVLCCLGPLFFAVVAAAQDSPPPRPWTALEARPLPPLIVADAQSRPKTLQELWHAAGGEKGGFLHLWAPSCLPCRAEMRSVDSHYARLTAAGYAVIALAQEPQGQTPVWAFARRYGLSALPLYTDKNNAAQMALRPRGLPATYRLDAEGRIVSLHEGSLDWATLP